MIELPPQSTIQPPDETQCQHQKHMPVFDVEAAKSLHYTEVRKRWPRFFGTCSDCKESVIMYESYAHFIYGDW